MGKSEYIIQFGGLPVGLHEFEFEVSDTFFSNIENSEIQSGDVNITATLTKQNHLLRYLYGTLPKHYYSFIQMG